MIPDNFKSLIYSHKDLDNIPVIFIIRVLATIESEFEKMGVIINDSADTLRNANSTVSATVSTDANADATATVRNVSTTNKKRKSVSVSATTTANTTD